ncbi:CBS domain containing protein [uncultured Desulfobacterium sp.]|uniref:CBS domain containing protein n=1 Tax=uncultured Desulfobacterium sp. TaxID=201089 RepID=A0A445MX95_9BACT|nr:CBS domain containing protein [uncultured Desulfobacterium sp.]
MAEQRQEQKIISEKNQEEVITTHLNADFDALASMIAAKKLYPDALLVFPGSQEKSLRNFFLFSTSYMFNFTKIKQVDLDRIKRLVIVDTRQKSRIGKFAELIGKKGIEIHIYDHHPPSADDIHGDLEVICKNGSNTSLLTGLIRKKGLSVTPEEATMLCLGIHEDTGSFTFFSTTKEDYEAAAWLTEQGANHNVISDMLTRELTAEQVWILNDLIQSAVTRSINGVDVVITQVVRDDYIGDFAVVVHKFMEMENINVVFALAQMEDRVYVVARSRTKDVNVAEIATALGGGGHPHAASATIKNKTLIQVERSLLALLRSRVNPARKAADMMSSPVINIRPDDTLKNATNLLTRYDINVLLVMDEAEDLKGYLTRQVVEKAIFFGLEDHKVKEYMNIEFQTVHPEATMREVQELIVREKLRILPVTDNGKVAGVITRTDLLNILLGDPVIPASLYDSKDSSRFARKKNMARLLKERLPPKIIQELRHLGEVADMLGYNAYLVGGVVRDVILRHDNLDIDIVIEGDGIRFAQKFAEYYKARVRSHKKFGTAVLIFPDGFKVDVATARMEYYEAPGAPPVVETSSLKLDLYRRDFTINTLAIKLNKRDYGTLIDYFGALNDIKEKVLRVLHNLSFVEDPTRMLRAIRFEQRFDFKIGKLTLALIKNSARMDYFKEPANRRFLAELRLILKEKDPVKAIKRMDEFNLLQFISPDLKFDATIERLFDEIKKVISWYNLLYLEGPFDPWKVYWHGLTSQLSIASLKEMAERSRMVDIESRRMLSQRQETIMVLDRLYKFSGDNYQLYTILSPYDTETLLFLMASSNSEKTKRMISNFFTKLKGTKIQLTGNDLLDMGFPEGPIYRDVFNLVMEARLNNLVKTKEDELRFVQEHFKHYL